MIVYLFRIEQVLDEQSAILMNECKVYDEAASKEEERADSIRGESAMPSIILWWTGFGTTKLSLLCC